MAFCTSNSEDSDMSVIWLKRGEEALEAELPIPQSDPAREGIALSIISGAANSLFCELRSQRALLVARRVCCGHSISDVPGLLWRISSAAEAISRRYSTESFALFVAILGEASCWQLLVLDREGLDEETFDRFSVLAQSMKAPSEPEVTGPNRDRE